MAEEMLRRWRKSLPTPQFDQLGPQLQLRCQKARHVRERVATCSQLLAEWIEQQSTPCFLLAGVLAYIRAVNESGLTAPLRYQVSSFEAWLERGSGFTELQKRQIRAKIMGQSLPREEYQKLFPIGQGRFLPSSHIVTGHASPDLDTTVASFWAWCDAWAAPVAERLHYWNLPGGLPDLVEVQFLMIDPFGPQLAELPKARTSLVLTAFDLLSTQPALTVALTDRLSAIPIQQMPVGVEDEQGVLVGELRQQDVDRVRQITNPLLACLHWFERYSEQVLVDFLASKQDPEALEAVMQRLLAAEIRQADPFGYQSTEQQVLIDKMLRQVLQISKGAQASFGDLAAAIGLQVGPPPLGSACLQAVQSFCQGEQSESNAFHLLSQLSHSFAETSDAVRLFLERIDQALKIKEQILAIPDCIVKGNADVEELRQRMGGHQALLSAVVDDHGRRFLEGLITAEDLRRSPVGTVSIRDFCNRDEVKIPTYFEIVSVVDHHKAALETSRAPTALLSDVQSVNTLMAEQMMALHLPYAVGGLRSEQIHQQLRSLAEVSSPSSLRRQQRLLSKAQGLARLDSATGGSFWVAPARQWWQALSTLFAILDDTDLLVKATWRDLDAVVNLLNLMGSLDQGQELEIVAFDDLPRDTASMSAARERVLSCDLLAGLLHIVLKAKHASLSANIEAAAQGRGSSLFADLKVQNGCAAVGQIKLFETNRALFLHDQAPLQNLWLQQSQDMNRQRPEIDLFIEMISSLSSDTTGKTGSTALSSQPSFIGPKSSQTDELWIWVPPPEASRVHLRVFLANLVAGPLQACRNRCTVTLVGPEKPGLDRVFREHFDQVDVKLPQDLEEGTYGNATFAVLAFPRGTLNSRKATVTPCLPRLGA